ncbi:UcrQ family protein [Colletotrichum orchidophilum]|uniref:Cytochrome b-c1 complex subunit 8 n=1 Tax=Colletotrichum orchidophilum TaxID=1209926 RepID=A0A1G4BSE0_9PEZI|nr:UcrQ family protein [Colletotrichum orchidophilum]OHF04283.1 UcrQ family protein [Colletotrichum orchidophilum]
MKPTQPMQTSPLVPIGQYGVWKGWWGNIDGEKQKGIITHSIVPTRLNILAEAGHGAVFNVWRRSLSQVWFFGPSMIAAGALCIGKIKGMTTRVN